jgi:hypothetical protein
MVTEGETLEDPIVAGGGFAFLQLPLAAGFETGFQPVRAAPVEIVVRFVPIPDLGPDLDDSLVALSQSPTKTAIRFSAERTGRPQRSRMASRRSMGM